MQVDIISNRANTVLENFISDDLRNCSSFNIASAFITDHALETLKAFIKRNRQRDKIGRILISLYGSFNSRSILMSLIQLAKSTSNIDIHISKNKRFHWKYYHFQIKKSHYLYIGSSNFTNDGLNSSGEMVTRIKLSQADQQKSVQYKESFDKEWEDSFPIVDFPINKYRQAPRISTSHNLHPSIEALFANNQSPSVPDVTGITRATLISGYLTAKTTKIVSTTKSHWDKRKWNYFSCESKREYESLGSVNFFLVIEKYNNQYNFALAKRVDNSSAIKTPDGRYFIAYKNTKRRKENSTLRKEVENLGINYHSRSFNSKNIRPAQSKAILKIFGI